MGVVAPNGQSASEFFDALVAGRSGITRVTPEIFPTANTLVAGQVAFDPSRFWPEHRASQLDRATQFALVAAQQAIADASLELDEQSSLRAGVYWGTGL